MNTDSGTESMNAPTMGSNHGRNCGSKRHTSPVHAIPIIVWTPWRRSACVQSVRASERAGERQRTARPSSEATTNWLWNSMRTGASKADSTHSTITDKARRTRPPNPFACTSKLARILGRNRTAEGDRKERDRALGTPFRPEREQLKRLHEILWKRERLHDDESRREDQRKQPEWRGQVRHDPRDEHRAMRRLQSLHQEQAQVHEVALAPPMVAGQLVDEVRGHLLVAACQVVGYPHRPACTTHQRRLDEVVGENLAARLNGRARNA